ncbi:hypothetical protein FXO38_06480 [Capsicum annuum]|nr:hypothetical protein FXO38_06480 [Capsicum annuum]KAF3674024.1 hypothetical protein FXO37_06623 [Capsicum annuum]
MRPGSSSRCGGIALVYWKLKNMKISYGAMRRSLPSNVKKLYLLIRAPDVNSTKHSFNNEMRDRPIGDLINGLKQLSVEVACFLGKKCPAVQIVSEGGLLGGKTLLHTIGNLGVIGPYADALTKLEYSLEDVAMQIPVPIVFRGPNGTAAGVGAQHSQGVFINPTLDEPFGLTLIETAAHGLPMVSTKNGGPVDIHGVKRPAFHGLVTLSPPPVHH